MTWTVASLGIGSLALLLVLLFVAFDLWGRSARFPDGPQDRPFLIAATTGVDAIVQLEQTGLKAAYLIQFGTNPAFTETEFASAVTTDAIKPSTVYPPPQVEVERYLVEHLSSENYMLVALRSGLARKVDHVLPSDYFSQTREAAVREQGPTTRIADDYVEVNSEGEIRRLYGTFPETRETFVALVNASYFTEATPEYLMQVLGPYLSQTTHVAVSIDEDDSWVDDSARQKAREFMDLLAASLR